MLSNSGGITTSGWFSFKYCIILSLFLNAVISVPIANFLAFEIKPFNKNPVIPGGFIPIIALFNAS